MTGKQLVKRAAIVGCLLLFLIKLTGGEVAPYQHHWPFVRSHPAYPGHHGVVDYLFDNFPVACKFALAIAIIILRFDPRRASTWWVFVLLVPPAITAVQPETYRMANDILFLVMTIYLVYITAEDDVPETGGSSDEAGRRVSGEIARLRKAALKRDTARLR